MNNLFIYCLPGLLFFSTPIYSQADILLEENFDAIDLPSGWVSTNSANDEENANWQWTEDGRANEGLFWNDRDPISSTSGGGAFVFDSDRIYNEFVIPFPHRSTLTTSTIDCSGAESVWLQFRQYYRSGLSNTFVGVSNNNGETWIDIPINQEITFGVETPNDSQIELDITDFAAGSEQVQIRFIFEGAYFFWIIDDVRVIDFSPFDPGYPGTFPPALGDSLTAWNIAYQTDSLGGAYPPNELVIQWVEGTSEAEKQQARDELGIIDYDTCSCSDLELFIFPNELNLTDTANLIVNGDFEAEEQGFYSELIESCTCGTNSYCIGTQFNDKCSSFNSFNFSGDGQFMIIDGAEFSSADIWCQDINLTNGEEYIFAFRGRSGQDFNLPDLQLYFNGIASNRPIQTVDVTAEWTYYYLTHTADFSGLTSVCLKQENFGFNSFDYAIDDLFLAELTGMQTLHQGGIENHKEKARASTAGTIQDAEENYYNFDIEELQDTTIAARDTFPLPNEREEAGENDILVAILDTGVDYNYRSDTSNPNWSWADMGEFICKAPIDSICYPNDRSGWNFVHRDLVNKRDRPFDDHGHGTHVAGILIQQWKDLSARVPIDECCDLKILPVKTHDFHGLGKLFDVSCGIAYATAMCADLINASWGFTAVQDTSGGILYNMIENAGKNNILLITSAGNSGVNIDSPLGNPLTPNYPSNYALNNIITVAALDSMSNRLDFSNYSNTKVDFATLGEDIASTIPIGTDPSNPGNMWQQKSGTSMAAPIVTAYASLLSCMENIDSIALLVSALAQFSTPIGELSSPIDDWSTLTMTGNTFERDSFLSKIEIDASCIAVNTTNPIEESIDWKVFPNPGHHYITVKMLNNEIPLRDIQLINLQGQVLWEKSLINTAPSFELEINLSDYPTGMYFLSLFSEYGVTTRSVIKVK